jgi:hypothetical protein
MFPSFAAFMLAIESNRVIAWRMMKLAAGGAAAQAEARLMVSEKVSEAMAAGVTLMTGGSHAAVVRRYRRRVAANARRLGRGRSR